MKVLIAIIITKIKKFFSKDKILPKASIANKMSTNSYYKIAIDQIINEVNRAISLGYFTCKVDVHNGDRHIIKTLEKHLMIMGYLVESQNSKYPGYHTFIISWDNLSINPLQQAMKNGIMDYNNENS